ncbi:MAG: hypothetical protein ACRDGS_01060 [Chloroflexota bacterium]
MIDPTFARQFSLAVQEDILRQAARDRLCHEERAARVGHGTAWLVRTARHLTKMLWTHPHRTDPRPIQVELPED